MTSAVRTLPPPLSGWRVGTLPPCTCAWRVSASSISNFIPFSVRAASPPSINGFSAATNRRAASATALASPAGGEARVSLGIRNRDRSVIPASCSPLSVANATGPIGGVMAIL